MVDLGLTSVRRNPAVSVEMTVHETYSDVDIVGHWGLGLSTFHISPDFRKPQGQLKRYRGGQLVSLKYDRQGYGQRKGNKGGVRGEVCGFSRKSRSRLLRKVAKLNQKELASPLFVTLTYPGEWEKDWWRWKTHLDNFSKRFERVFTDGFFFWKLEFQRRGAPHFHLMVFDIDTIDIDWLSKAWYEVVGSGDERHLRAGTQVEKSRGWQRVTAYCAKYLGKDVSSDHVGRIWGLRGQGNFNRYVDEIVHDIPCDTFNRFRRILANYIGSQYRNKGEKKSYTYRENDGISCFLEEETVKRLLRLGAVDMAGYLGENPDFVKVRSCEMKSKSQIFNSILLIEAECKQVSHRLGFGFPAFRDFDELWDEGVEALREYYSFIEWNVRMGRELIAINKMRGWSRMDKGETYRAEKKASRFKRDGASYMSVEDVVKKLRVEGKLLKLVDEG